ncbi:ring-opening amidohydrolase [Candidatus Nitrosacidococcus tergens]|uniref:Putative Cyanuric acid amidohydrolase n=1 Tax=Candidatus Nitrosacidococcus tergens TaxID=553981 RepID=A0A7G1Q9N4_9GAMM|nr:ring-opening amidohydrolase [Candidatus Nitrosacidococcus tergens]CAB1276106.1 putative Cyanuric acid amidohydrolase [Candidatus Nitrosacidococcus tergens]
MKIEIYRLSMENPGDAQGLQQLLDNNLIKASQIVAIIGKTEGNGGANDFTRALATHAITAVLSKALNMPSSEVINRIAIAWSGGCEGVLSPHMTVFTRDISANNPNPSDDKREDPNLSKKYARGAMALGVAIGLKEIPKNAVTNESIAHDMSLYSSVASTSAGGEINSCEVVVFGNSPTSTSQYRIGHATLANVTDIDGVRAAIRSAGLNIHAEATEAEVQKIAAIFAKADAPIHGVLWGQRTTMLSDADIHYERHARAALGAVITSVTHDSRIFISGATEHQCALGYAPIAVIVKVADSYS